VAAPQEPPPLRADSLRVERAIDPQSGQVVSYYVHASTGQRVETLAPTYSLLDGFTEVALVDDTDDLQRAFPYLDVDVTRVRDDGKLAFSPTLPLVKPQPEALRPRRADAPELPVEA
jgi:hypothetical protein